MSRITKPLVAAIAVLLFIAPFSYAGGKKDQAAQSTPSAPSAPSAPAAPRNSYFTGDGGRGMSLAVLVPSAQGIAANQNYLPTMVQGVLVGDLTKYSAVSVLDRLRLETVLRETESGIYKNEEDFGRLGEIANVDYALTGSITRTGSGYAMQVQVVGTGTKTIGITKAAYSGSFTIAELDDFTGIRKASLELLTQMGVALTDAAKNELSGAAAVTVVNAQTAAARGIVAQQLGNAAEALTQFYQAAAYDPSFAEAAARANTMSTSVRTGRLGADIRNDIAWRDEWVKIFADAQTALRNIPYPPRPSTLQQIVVAQIVVPEPNFQRGAVDYTARTAVLSVNFDASKSLFPVPYPSEYRAACDAYSAAFAARADVYNKIVRDLNAGLQATRRNDAWKLDWLIPTVGTVSIPSPRSEVVTIRAVVELLNDQGRVIGNVGNVPILGRFGFEPLNTVLIQRTDIRRFAFTVKADDISDQMSLRFTVAADPAPNNIVQVMTLTELKSARPSLFTTSGAVTPTTPKLPDITIPEMVRINGGTFRMGYGGVNEYNGPVHTVTVSSFYMGKYEVTQKEWTAVMGSNPSKFKGDNLPVERVSWYDAVEFCNKLSQTEGLTPSYTISGRTPATGYPITSATVTWNRNANGYRLPTEAEREYADQRGPGFPDEGVWWGGNYSATHDVGTKKPDVLGLYDMGGNVEEWCWDWYVSGYPSEPQTDPTGPSSGQARVLRGGHVNSHTTVNISRVNRESRNPNSCQETSGFRLARNAQ